MIGDDVDFPDAIVRRLQAARPVPSEALRATIEQRYEDVDLSHRPANLRTRISVLAVGAVALLALALLGAVGSGPLG